MKNNMTLVEFLENSGAQVRLYDIGRRISEIDRDTFVAFEKTDIPYPFPMQRQAWFAIIQVRTSEVLEPVIWFMRLNLDEQGKLIQATRDYLIHRFVEIAAEAGEEDADLGKALEDNPYTFKPREDRMAVFHAKFNLALGHKPSRFYEHALEYFSGTPGWDQWNFVGYQGIADVAARVEQAEIANLLSEAITNLPAEPLNALCQCLENEELPGPLADALAKRLEQATEQQDAGLTTVLIRALALTPDTETQNALYQRALASHLGNQIELLAAIAGRAWQCLLSPELAKLYLEKLAENDHGQEAFNQCLSDLLAMPGLQQPLLDVVRNEARSDSLAKAFQSMTQGGTEA